MKKIFSFVLIGFLISSFSLQSKAALIEPSDRPEVYVESTFRDAVRGFANYTFSLVSLVGMGEIFIFDEYWRGAKKVYLGIKGYAYTRILLS